MSAGVVVKFPTRRRVLERLGLSYPNRRACIDQQIRRINTSIDTLKKAKAALLIEYRKKLRREIDKMSGY